LIVWNLPLQSGQQGNLDYDLLIIESLDLTAQSEIHSKQNLWLQHSI